MKILFFQMLRFGLVGLINAGVDAAVFFLALATVTRSLVLANVAAWTVAVTCSYVLNSRFTFAERAGGVLSLKNYFMFALTQSGGLAANTLVLLATAPHVPLVLAKLFAIGAGFVVNFSLARGVVFRAR